MTLEKHPNFTPGDKNPRFVYVWTNGNKIRKPNPDYNPRKCSKCGLIHGLFQINCKEVRQSE